MSGSSRLRFVAMTFWVLTRAAAGGDGKGAAQAPVTFEKDIAPRLSASCQPCHYPGGKVYAKMPFDRPETIRTLGTKLFTRIKDEKDQAMIRSFLATVPAKPQS
jgi:hypothetical protein